MSPFAHITGWGMAVPERILTNYEISQIVDTTDEWIQKNTGIRERRVASEDQSTATLAVDAAMKALELAGLSPEQLDLIIVSTSSPEYIFPATACIVQDHIGATKAGAFDLLAACSGFIYALNMASQAIRAGSVQNALVIGSETLSRIVNWKDRATCILFGDGAGAFVLQASDTPGGILAGIMRSDGSGGDLLALPGGGSKHPATLETVELGLHFVKMNGHEVFRFATRVMSQATKDVAAAAGFQISDINLVIPHQANRRIIEAAMRGLDMPMERCMVNLERYGNTSTASIPIATVEAVETGRIKPGDKLVFVGFGAGLTWGSLAVQWSGPILPKRKMYPASYHAWVRVRSLLLRIVRRVEATLWGNDINNNK